MGMTQCLIPPIAAQIQAVPSPPPSRPRAVGMTVAKWNFCGRLLEALCRAGFYPLDSSGMPSIPCPALASMSQSLVSWVYSDWAYGGAYQF